MDQKPDATPSEGDEQPLIQQLEELITYIEHSQAICNTMFDAIRRECNDVINKARHRLPESGSQIQFSNQALKSIPESQLSTIPIEDRKLKKAWATLAQYPNGATAEDIMKDMKRHRTTVSTYLNQLVLLNFAKKERRGHEIYYRAVLYKEEGEKE